MSHVPPVNIFFDGLSTAGTFGRFTVTYMQSQMIDVIVKKDTAVL